MNNKMIEVTSKSAQVNIIIKENQAFLGYIGEKTFLPNEWVEIVTSNKLGSFRLSEINVTGEEDHVHVMGKGAKQSGTAVGNDLLVTDDVVIEQEDSKILKITQKHERLNIEVETYYQLYNDTSVIRTWKKVINNSTNNIGLESIASLSLSGLLQNNFYNKDYAKNISLYLAHNGWTSEAQWVDQTLSDHGLVYMADGMDEEASSKRISITNNSSWSASEFSPQGMLHNQVTDETSIWQIENNGAWHFEITDAGDGSLLNIQLSGPEEYDNHWWKSIKPGEEFETVKVSYTQVKGNFEKAIGELTKYRRLIRRKSFDNSQMPVIFNDYMNGLMGDPTTKNEIPLIDKAHDVGAEYYVIDCGWYDSGDWWDSVGEWMPSFERFPNGIEELTTYIQDKGMVPGLWLEIEVMGINSQLANTLPDDWFFMRHGKRVKDIGRYHLDFRNNEVRKYATGIVERLVKDYHLGYIKMDYNTPTGIGTDYMSDSLGDGLLEHNRAYLDWIDSVFEEYPDLVIENCGSGGLRHDYAMLSRHSIQSLTDQTDYVRNGAIASVGSSIITPEQCAIWSYPLKNGDREEVIYNMINSMLGRIHQSGYLNRLTDERISLVKEGIDVYKGYRNMINKALPVWPTGLGRMDDKIISSGLQLDNEIILAIECSEYAGDNVVIDLSTYGNFTNAEIIYPVNDKEIEFGLVENKLSVDFKKDKMARLFKIYN
ncbi:alpha-galactosidase [Dellaglioa algida]|uniref:Alpha-galactosidase n=1 Tax=Dellaglioa algida TaxID=105612 RepID=A0A5C6MB21_9LACO|nr:alpha-galactosidase [Dellaglioa algida]MDK1716092.1 alpha-galactosidase [Dellaglioa algida]MDK1719373.1 alpha-galactosidase [Dellaglioa algida]MDK1721125.1 alpha-galactosidase [Dellaglioa algida]MDK1722716.1 alpha-galactosidase [Dellaglioa algida]MDK1724335.1 alpha-galactosidase [Dellaglioa algida]